MGLIVRVKRRQRLWLDNTYIEVEKTKGQYQVYIGGERKHEIKKENAEDYRKRTECEGNGGDKD